MQMRSASFMRAWPTYSASVWGRSAASTTFSSALGCVVTMRSGMGLAPSWRLRHGQMRRSHSTCDTPLSGRSRLDVPTTHCIPKSNGCPGAGEPDTCASHYAPAAQGRFLSRHEGALVRADSLRQFLQCLADDIGKVRLAVAAYQHL